MNVLRGWLFDNIGLKLLALLLAVLVYANVYTDRSATRIVSFPIDYSDLPDSLALAGTAPAAVQVEVRATLKQLYILRWREPSYRLPLASAVTGHYSRALVPSDLPLPADAGYTVDNIVGPRVIEIDLDRRARRDLPVSARVEGAPAPGYRWDHSLQVDPAVVHVVGPHHALAELDSVPLAPLRLDGKRDSVRADLAPAGMPEHCSVDPPLVHVRLALRRH